MNRMTRRVLSLVTFTGVLLALAIAGLTRSDTGAVTVALDGPGPTATVTTSSDALSSAGDVGDHAGAVQVPPECEIGVLHLPLHDWNQGPCVPRESLAAGLAQQAKFAKRDDLPVDQPAAAPQQPGCRTRLVGNFSSRNGVAPRLFVPHYTVSSNRPGFDDVNAITALFDRASFAASSTYVIDRDGNCNYIVREADKPWTQATFNPVSISVEIINTGSERPLFTPSGMRRFARIASDSAGRWDIPVRRGMVAGCRVVRSGFVDHNDLGPCGGGHVDVTPFDVDDLITAVKRHRRNKTVTARRCRELTRLRAEAVARRQAHRRPAWRAAPRERAEALKVALGAREVRCR